MPNFASVVKEEIARISKRETKKAIAVLQRASVGYRRDIAKLKREIASLERQLKQTSKRRTVEVEETDDDKSVRFSAGGLRSLRQRLGLSAANFGKIMGVSEQSVYNWETKVTKPRREHVLQISRMRGMSKRDAQEKLQKA